MNTEILEFKNIEDVIRHLNKIKKKYPGIIIKDPFNGTLNKLCIAYSDGEELIPLELYEKEENKNNFCPVVCIGS